MSAPTAADLDAIEAAGAEAHNRHGTLDDNPHGDGVEGIVWALGFVRHEAAITGARARICCRAIDDNPYLDDKGEALLPDAAKAWTQAYLRQELSERRHHVWFLLRRQTEIAEDLIATRARIAVLETKQAAPDPSASA